ncbi:MAG: Trk system potassium transporter TrkA [Bacteroidales bacterium]|nr:Trk system potassium transporter TrkA [Bacteroidales bacterium]
MNIIIAGDGEVGLHLAELLAVEQHNITIVDPHEDLLNTFGSHTDLLTVAGDSTSISIMNNANIKKADLMISVVHDEKTNLLSCILAKKLGARRTIARINSTEYLTQESQKLLRDLGIDALVCPEKLAAKEIVNLLHQSAATEIFDFSDGKLSLFLIKLEENAPVIKKTLDQIANEYPDLGFRAIAIHRNSKTIIPRGNDYFMKNDLSYVLTKPDSIDLLLKLGGKQKFDIKDIMVIGGGRIGRKTAASLDKHLNIKLIEKDKERCNSLADQLDNTLVINGDAREIDLLIDEGIKGMDAFIAVTDNSETNILTCLHARKFGVKKTIALVENIDYIDISQNIGIDTIINKKLITASYIASFTMHAKVASIKHLSGINAEVLELVAEPSSMITKKPIRKLKIPTGAIIGGITRGKESFIADGDFQINENDKVVVFSLPEAVSKIEKFFK